MFVHVPKTGGSYIEYQLARCGYSEYFSIRGMHPQLLDFAICSPQHYDSSLLSQCFKFLFFDKIFMICRDPYERIKSEYYWQRRLGMVSSGPSDWLANVFDAYAADPYICAYHIRPQVEFIVDGVKIFKLEDDGVNAALRFVLGDFFRQYITFGLSSLVRGGAIACKKSRRDSLVEEEFKGCQSLIRDFYADDYERFGYTIDKR